VPTPDPDPDDFVDEVDNPWLPLSPGALWTYDAPDGGTVELAVTDARQEVAGITTTVVAQQGDDGATTRLLVAQDTDGNVWLLGEDGADGSWEAGVDGAGAGLLMPARPRAGDGFRAGPDRVLTVTATDGTADVPAGRWEDVVVVEDSDGDESWFARGVGPVLLDVDDPGGRPAQLAGFGAAAAG